MSFPVKCKFQVSFDIGASSDGGYGVLFIEAPNREEAEEQVKAALAHLATDESYTLSVLEIEQSRLVQQPSIVYH